MPDKAVSRFFPLVCFLMFGAALLPRAARAQQMQIIAGYVPTPANYPPSCIPFPLGPIYICNSGDTAAAGGAYSAPYPTGIWIPAPAPAVSDEMHQPVAVAAAPNGSVYIADQTGFGAGPPQIREVNTSGNMATYALRPGYQVFTSVVVDTLGNVYSSDDLGNIYVNAQCSNVTGTEVPGVPGTPISTEGGALWECLNNTSLTTPSPTNTPVPFTPNHFATPAGGTVEALALDTKNNVYALSCVPDGGIEFWTITEYNPAGSVLRTFSYSNFASVLVPAGLAVDSSGNIYTTNAKGNGENEIVEIAPDGALTTAASYAQVPLLDASTENAGLAIDPDGNLYFIADGGGMVQEYSPVTKVVTQIAGTGTNGFNAPNDPYSPSTPEFSAAVDAPSPATATDINQVVGISIGPDRSLYIADTLNNMVRKLLPVKMSPSSTIQLGANSYTVTFTLTNEGYLPITNLTVQSATLGGLPALSFPSGTTASNIAPGASATFTGTFSSGAGSPGQTVAMLWSGKYTSGSLSGNWGPIALKVILP